MPWPDLDRLQPLNKVPGSDRGGRPPRHGDLFAERGFEAARVAAIARLRVGFQRWVDAIRPKDLRELLRSSLDEPRALAAGA